VSDMQVRPESLQVCPDCLQAVSEECLSYTV